MSIPVAYLGVVLIWSTTPLAIQWSGQEINPLFGLSSRMLIGMALLLLLHTALRKPLRRDQAAWRVYLAGGLGLYCAMTCVYWAARYIPSGWISVIFGTTPLATGLMAMLWLNEKALTPLKFIGLLLGLGGLGIMFYSGRAQQGSTTLGVMLVLSAVMFHSLSAVWIKRLNPGLDGVNATTGSLLIATPLYLVTWWMFDGTWPQTIPTRAGMAILYLGIFGSVIGFILYFYLLRSITTGHVALITLITPVIALWLGQWINGETITLPTLLGTAVILIGLACHTWEDMLFAGVPIADRPSRKSVRAVRSVARRDDA